MRRSGVGGGRGSEGRFFLLRKGEKTRPLRFDWQCKLSFAPVIAEWYPTPRVIYDGADTCGVEGRECVSEAAIPIMSHAGEVEVGKPPLEREL